jgi:hypothetical protein
MMTEFLKSRIEKYSIPPWPGQALYHRVFIWNVPDEFAAADRSEGGIIYTDERHELEKSRCPRGVIVSAGQGALEVMASHGMQLGDMVYFSPHNLYRLQVNRKGGEFRFMDIGEVVSDVDLLLRMHEGEDEKMRTAYSGESPTKERTDPEVYADSI